MKRVRQLVFAYTHGRSNTDTRRDSRNNQNLEYRESSLCTALEIGNDLSKHLRRHFFLELLQERLWVRIHANTVGEVLASQAEVTYRRHEV
jgi:hypothetical protein